MDTTKTLMAMLNERRHDLDMPVVAVSRRSGVPVTTVRRLLAGDLSVAGFEIVCRVARALGVAILVRGTSIVGMKRQAARAAATRIMKTVQATSALEAQAVSPQTLRLIRERIESQLLAGPGYRLWAE